MLTSKFEWQAAVLSPAVKAKQSATFLPTLNIILAMFTLRWCLNIINRSQTVQDVTLNRR